MNLKKDFNLTHEDGFTLLTIADSDFETVAETRKGKDGETVATGITKRVFHYCVSQSSVDKGEGAITVKPNGTAITREVKVVIRDQDEAAIRAKREATRWANFGKDFRRFCGLSKSAKAVDASDKLTRQDVENFCNGLRKVKGYFYDDLPQSAKDAVTRAYADLLKKEREKPPTLAQLAELAALATAEGKALGQDWMKAFEQAKAQVAKMKAGKAAKAASAATQGDD